MAIDLFNPRKALTAHLQKLVGLGVIRGVGQAASLSEVLSGHFEASHAYAYVTFDKSKDIKTQGKHSVKSIESYVVILAWQNNRPSRSHHGHGMDVSGEIKNIIEFHINGWSIDGDYQSKSTGNPFTLSSNPPEAFYRAGGWAFYPMAFDISMTRTRPQPPYPAYFK